MSTIKKFKWFWAWEDEKEEDWLAEMSANGYHLKSIGIPGIYTFDAGASRNYVYRLDFNAGRKGYQEYLQIFQDAGWEHLCEYGSWKYFRTQAQGGEIPEIYTDNESKVKKYSRIMLFLIIFLPIYTMMLRNLSKASGLFYEIATVVFFLFMLIYAYAILMFIRRIGQLKKKL
jgi:hypothetical protein